MGLRELESAQNELLQSLAPLPEEHTTLDNALHRIASRPISAAIDLPPFDNSAMDGYALRSKDTAEASAQHPVTFRVIAEFPAGRCLAPPHIRPGECARIFTGSILPPDCDAVVMQEDVERLEDPPRIRLQERITPWESVRFKGEDLKSGQRLLEPGESITVGSLARLAACGTSSVWVHRQPRVHIVTSGTELVVAGRALEPGQIYESNGVVLAAMVQRAGGIPTVMPHVPDQSGPIRQQLEAAFAAADVVVTVGGASVGDHDLIRPVFESMGGSLDFWRLALKPGKPFFCGKLGGKTLLGLPGNPVSAVVTALLLVHPALRRLQGATVCMPSFSQAILAEPLRNPDRRRHFMRVRQDADGRLRLAGVQASHVVSSLATADGLVDVPPGCTVEAGTLVRFLTLV